MSYILTFDGLVKAMKAYNWRSDVSFDEVIPLLITLAEKQVADDCEIIGFSNYVRGNFVVGNPVLAKPTRWINTLSLTYAAGTPPRISIIEPRSYEYCRTYTPKPSDPTTWGEPVYYADYDADHWLIVPTPDQAYEFEIAYLQSLVPLDSANQTNWLTLNAPQLLIYRCMIESTPYLMNDERLPTWQAMYQRALEGVLRRNNARTTDRSVIATKD